MKNMLLILNPCSGQRRAKKYFADIIAVFNRADYAVLTHVTACCGDAEAAVLHHAENVDLIVCCGGDGTFNETVSGIMKSGKNIPIGFIPSGSTNDFAASLHLSSNILQAAQDIADGIAEPLDIGSFNGRYFSYVASFGAFTRASYATPQELKNALGHAAYILSGIQELSQIRSHHLTFLLSDGTAIEDDFIFGAVSNSTSVGGILTLAPNKVDMQDGLLEVLLIRAPKDLTELRDCVKALQQKTYQCAMITFSKNDRVQISAPTDMAWTLDGELEHGHRQIDVRCIHHAIQVHRSPR